MHPAATCYLLAALGLTVALTSSAYATVIFSDDFTRANSTTVGNGWVEGANVSVDTQTMLLAGNVTAAASHTVSTIGSDNIQFSYDWRGDGSEAPDTLTVAWSADGTTFNTLATHSLSSTSFASASWSLPDAAEGLSSMVIRFTYTGDMGNDGSRVDNVSVTGDVATRAVPEPASLALLASSLLGFGIIRRRRKNR
jgi:hypothetical protein